MRFTNMITAVDAHAGGEPGRVITGGVLDMPGDSVFEKMKWMEKNADHIRQRMLREPAATLCCAAMSLLHPRIRMPMPGSLLWSRQNIQPCPGPIPFVLLRCYWKQGCCQWLNRLLN